MEGLGGDRHGDDQREKRDVDLWHGGAAEDVWTSSGSGVRAVVEGGAGTVGRLVEEQVSPREEQSFRGVRKVGAGFVVYDIVV
jgi:hypothetical protein